MSPNRLTARFGPRTATRSCLATAVASQNAKPGIDFLPLTVDYQEKAYAAGKIPGGYFKREGRPSEKEVLTSRLIDRPLRPLFPEGYYFETQVIASVLSADRTGSSDVIGITAASAALAVSNIPFHGPIAGVKIGRVNGQFVVNPDLETLKSSELDLVVAGTADAVMMVEAGANELPEATMLEAIELAHAEIKKIVAKINELRVLVRQQAEAGGGHEADRSRPCGSGEGRRGARDSRCHHDSEQDRAAGAAGSDH